MSDRSSPNDQLTPEITTTRSHRDEMCYFLDEATLSLKHFGPRAVMLGDIREPSPSTSVVRERGQMRASEYSRQVPERQPSMPRASTSSISAGASYSGPSTRRFVSPPGRSGRSRRYDRGGAALKYNFTPEETRVYEAFIRLLSNFEADEMFDIISDVLKDAKSHFAGQ